MLSIKNCGILLLAGSCFIYCCKKTKQSPAPPVVVPSSDKSITAFNFKAANNTGYLIDDAVGVIGTDSVKITVPAETDISRLKPEILFTGKTITPATALDQNFTSPLNYTITAADGSTKKYVVSITFRTTVFICSLGGIMYALDGMNGQEIWKSTTEKFYSGSPSVYKGIVYICGIDGLYALDAGTGVEKWKMPIISNTATSEFLPSPVTADNTVYFSASDGFVYALNTGDGSLKWKTPSTTGMSFSSNVTLNSNTLFTGCKDSSLYAIHLSDGTINWKFKMGDAIVKNPLVVNNWVYTAGRNGSYYMLNGATGSVIWKGNNDFHVSSPTYDNGVIYCGGGTRGSGNDFTTGARLWSLYELGPGGTINNERSSAEIRNGVYYAGSNNGTVCAYNINTNAKIWSLTTSGNFVFASPVIAEGMLFIGAFTQKFYAIDILTGAIKWSINTKGGIMGSACVIDQAGIKHYPGNSGEKN